MKIYLDLVIILNFILDLILLMSVNYILRRNVKEYRLIIGSLIGSLTLLLLFIKMNNFLLFLYKVLVSFVMLIVCFGYKDILYFFKNVLYFYMVSMLIGGAIDFLNNQFSYTNDGLVFINNGLSISYLIIIILCFFIYFIYINCFINLKNNYSNYYSCKLYFNNQIIDCNAFLDTGNKLKDPYSNKSIILLDSKYINCDSKYFYVPYNSLNNHGLLKCYKGDKLVINGKECNNFLVGISDNNFFMDGIDCIINLSVMEGLK